MANLAEEAPRLDEEIIDEYTSEGLWPGRTFVEFHRETLAEYPDRFAHGPNRSVRFSELDEEAERVAAALQDRGFGSGDVISYQLPNWVSTIAVNMAIARIGAVANPIIPIYRGSELRYILNDAGTKCIFVPHEFRNHDYLDMLEDVQPDVDDLEQVVTLEASASDVDPSVSGVDTIRYADLVETASGDVDEPSMTPNDAHVLAYTSGTTGDPKGAIHTHNTICADVVQAMDALDVDEETTIYMPSPVTHVTGLLLGLVMPFMAGSNVVFQDIWDPAEAIELVEEYDCTLTVGATPFLQTVLEAAPEDWDCPLEVFGCGGADVPPGLIYRARDELDCVSFRAYGSTEHLSVTQSTRDTPAEKAAETDGPLPEGVRAKIVDIETRDELPDGEVGELLTQGPDLMVGYLGEELNEEAFEGDWYTSGDLAKFDDDGYLQITGRLGDIIIRGGENIPVSGVEDLLHGHPDIQEVAIVAMPDERMQEKACAYVHLTDGADIELADVVDYLDDHDIAKQKYPERLEVVDSLPKTASGKIKKNRLREDIADKLNMTPVHKE